MLFRVNADGTAYTNLHTFTGIDGEFPCGNLIVSDSVLYGAAGSGGSFRHGTVFKINTDGSGFFVLKHFAFSEGNLRNLWHPRSGLTISGTTLYGTTFEGGVYKLQTDGTGFTDLQVNAYGLGGTLAIGGNTLYGIPFYSTPFKVNTDGSSYTSLCPVARGTGGFTLDGGTLYGTSIDLRGCTTKAALFFQSTPIAPATRFYTHLAQVKAFLAQGWLCPVRGFLERPPMAALLARVAYSNSIKTAVLSPRCTVSMGSMVQAAIRPYRFPARRSMALLSTVALTTRGRCSVYPWRRPPYSVLPRARPRCQARR